MFENAFLFAGLVFSGRFLDPHSVGLACAGFAAFCLLSSSGYVLNDYLDRDADRRHPKKRHRPIASGALRTRMPSGPQGSIRSVSSPVVTTIARSSTSNVSIESVLVMAP